MSLASKTFCRQAFAFGPHHSNVLPFCLRSKPKMHMLSISNILERWISLSLLYSLLQDIFLELHVLWWHTMTRGQQVYLHHSTSVQVYECVCMFPCCVSTSHPAPNRMVPVPCAPYPVPHTPYYSSSSTTTTTPTTTVTTTTPGVSGGDHGFQATLYVFHIYMYDEWLPKHLQEKVSLSDRGKQRETVGDISSKLAWSASKSNWKFDCFNAKTYHSKDMTILRMCIQSSHLAAQDQHLIILVASTSF